MRNQFFTLLIIFVLGILSGTKGNCQNQGSDTIQIPAITIQATKIESVSASLPSAVSVYKADVLQTSKQQLNLQEFINDVPGLFSLNALNYAQDLRISIRGFGARAAFGIRGIKLIIDGIPETTPDGQGQLDNLNLGLIDQIEILRGPASALYGNAAGGVINIQTFQNVDSAFTQVGLSFGSFQFQQYQLMTAQRFGKTRLILQGSYSAADGYRKQSGFEAYNLNARILHDFSERSKLSIQLNYSNSPKADDPGGINIESVEEDRRQARDRNIDFKTGESIDQFKFGISYDQEFKNNFYLNAYAFLASRNFEGRLPFEFGGWVDLNRLYFGEGGSIRKKHFFSKGLNEMQLGYTLANQIDDRDRFRNLMGERGTLTLDQNEKFYSASVYFLDHLYLGNWMFNVGLRYDWNRLEAEDQLLNNGDDSGEIKLGSFNPSVGLSYQLSAAGFIYGNFSTSFETPSLSELSANPSGEDGFNPNLKPQRAINYELGLKKDFQTQWAGQVALFYIKTENELVPFELSAFPDRDFFQNAGSSDRIGIEMMFNYVFKSYWKLKATYTYSDFTFSTFQTPDDDFSGKALPGIPKHAGSLELSYVPTNGFHARLFARMIGKLYTDNENAVSDNSYALINLQMGHQLTMNKLTLIPFLGIKNLLDSDYNDNIRINAFGARYFEPGPGINFYGGIRIRI